MGKRVTVTDGYAVYVNGDQVHGGDTVAVDNDTAEHWIARGWATPATPTAKPTRRTRSQRAI